MKSIIVQSYIGFHFLSGLLTHGKREGAILLVFKEMFLHTCILKGLSQGFLASLSVAKIYICVAGNLKMMAHFYSQLALLVH